ncbi:hypothetical protein [Nannocystis pusilla]|uniref:hypothetical protein n=1 Tax=Nannocystis pusilla TaxID=889268 RepID=UPI003B75F484
MTGFLQHTSEPSPRSPHIWQFDSRASSRATYGPGGGASTAVYPSATQHVISLFAAIAQP